MFMSAASDPDQLATTIHDRMRRAGLRLTLPRRAICAVLARNSEEFLTGSDLQTAVETEAGGPVDASTIYRTLNELAHLGIVHHVNFGTGPGRWHLTVEHDHHHLACETCGAMTRVPVSELQPTFDYLRETYGFYVSRDHFAILGQCENCQRTAGHSHD
jgi:Fe2+ or Zn2+ uptake regulation protein